MRNHNFLEASSSIKWFEKNDIEVIVGILEEECHKLNEIFTKYITKQKSVVILKEAISMIKTLL